MANRKVTAVISVDIEGMSLWDVYDRLAKIKEFAEGLKQEFPETSFDAKERRGSRRTKDKPEFVSRRRKVAS